MIAVLLSLTLITWSGELFHIVPRQNSPLVNSSLGTPKEVVLRDILQLHERMLILCLAAGGRLTHFPVPAPTTMKCIQMSSNMVPLSDLLKSLPTSCHVKDSA